MAAMMRTSTLIGLRAPQAFDHALLQHAEQLDLDFHRQIADLVEEQRGLVGGFEPADLPRERARIRALLAAEQLALDEGRRNGRAAHADHRPLMARAQVVNRLRHHLLARACFAEQQDGGGRGRDLFDLREHLLDGGAFRPERVGHPERRIQPVLVKPIAPVGAAVVRAIDTAHVAPLSLRADGLARVERMTIDQSAQHPPVVDPAVRVERHAVLLRSRQSLEPIKS